MKVSRHHYGKLNGSDVFQYHLINDTGMELRAINYGGIVTHLLVPDVHGEKLDVVLGLESIEDYLGDHPYFGAIVGRYGNRIANGQFTLDGQQYQLPINLGQHCLHGGIQSFSHKLWETHILDGEGIELSLYSEDGDQGFPGNLEMKVRYLLKEENSWVIQYEATVDAPTILNPTQHSYFNLNGHQAGDVLHHELTIHAQDYTPVDETMIPIGRHQSVINTPFDFRTEKKIGKDMDGGLDPMLDQSRGYDINYMIDGQKGELKKTATVWSPVSGIRMDVLTTEPGAQLYTGNWLNGISGKEDSIYDAYHGFCIETQHPADAPNQPGFPGTILRPGEKFYSETIYRFDIQSEQ